MDFSAAMLDPSPLDSNFHVPMIFISIAMNQSADATPQLCPILVDKFILTIIIVQWPEVCDINYHRPMFESNIVRLDLVAISQEDAECFLALPAGRFGQPVAYVDMLLASLLLLAHP
mmetsp:Transcript_36187/g.75266  ORF Transcript_36187/g.75266 Transcript_36187/m.75266 type:complete len:117 (+) Transcript_36187:2564-2914(+)